MLLPVPVPASTMRWLPSFNARVTAVAICTWAGRCSYPGVSRASAPSGDRAAAIACSSTITASSVISSGGGKAGGRSIPSSSASARAPFASNAAPMLVVGRLKAERVFSRSAS